LLSGLESRIWRQGLEEYELMGNRNQYEPPRHMQRW
jgi:hypothetical protein